MKTVDQVIAEIIEREGGYVNHPADRGGPTKYGITQATARAAGYFGAISALPLSIAQAIYRAQYWTRPGFDQVAKRAPVLAAELFDTGVNMGPGVAGRFLQRVLNVLNLNGRHYPDLVVDGQIGAKSLAALDALLKLRGAGAEAGLVATCDGLQAARYVEIAETDPSQEAFAYGWLANRVGQAK